MKIRTGFVSNSSSSSFVCWGIPFEDVVVTDKMALEYFNTRLYNVKDSISFYKKKIEEGDDYKGYKDWIPEKEKELEQMNLCNSEEEKIAFVKSKNLSADCFINRNKNGITCGGQEDEQYVGIQVSYIEYKFPELKFGEVRQFVADSLNDLLGTDYKKENVQYTEQGWYNG